MLHRTTIISAMIIVVFFSTNLFAAQYENYKWGATKQEVLQQVNEKGYKIELEGDSTVIYTDNLFDKKIDVFLVFTPKTKLLYMLWIENKDSSVGRDLKPILTKKYGEPERPNQFMDDYTWFENNKPSLSLKYDHKTSLTYYSAKYILIYKKEEAEIHAKEAEIHAKEAENKF